MSKPTCVALAILILPLLASATSPPASEEPDVREVGTGTTAEPELVAVPGATFRVPLTVAGQQFTVELPGGFRQLKPEQRRTLRTYLERRAPVAGNSFCLAGDPSLCGFGAAAAHMKPCLAANASDCPAFEAWTEVFGDPGIVPADPEILPARLEQPEDEDKDE